MTTGSKEKCALSHITGWYRWNKNQEVGLLALWLIFHSHVGTFCAQSGIWNLTQSRPHCCMENTCHVINSCSAGGVAPSPGVKPLWKPVTNSWWLMTDSTFLDENELKSNSSYIEAVIMRNIFRVNDPESILHVDSGYIFMFLKWLAMINVIDFIKSWCKILTHFIVFRIVLFSLK